MPLNLEQAKRSVACQLLDLACSAASGDDAVKVLVVMQPRRRGSTWSLLTHALAKATAAAGGAAPFRQVFLAADRHDASRLTERLLERMRDLNTASEWQLHANSGNSVFLWPSGSQIAITAAVGRVDALYDVQADAVYADNVPFLPAGAVTAVAVAPGVRKFVCMFTPTQSPAEEELAAVATASSMTFDLIADPGMVWGWLVTSSHQDEHQREYGVYLDMFDAQVAVQLAGKSPGRPVVSATAAEHWPVFSYPAKDAAAPAITIRMVPVMHQPRQCQ